MFFFYHFVLRKCFFDDFSYLEPYMSPCFLSFTVHSCISFWFRLQYHKTIEAVYSVENSVETLLDLLQRYREKAGDKVAEKGGSIFTKACFLLALLLQDKHRAVVCTYYYRLTFEICYLQFYNNTFLECNANMPTFFRR